VPSLAVVDTNVLVSALLKPGSVPAQVLQAVRHDRLLPVVCAEIMAEYAAVLRRPRFGLQASDTDELLHLLGLQARWVHVAKQPAALRLPDAGDWPFMACAAAAQCPVITGNLKHFPAGLGIEVMTARAWLDRHG
jgi:uncharacterized protein